MAKSPDEAMNIALSANDLARIGFALRQLSKNTTKKPAIHVLGQEHTVDKKTPQP